MLSVEQNNRVCLIRLERPPVNALDSALLETLAGEIARAGAVDGQAIILCGTPGRFCAGLDTGELGAATPKERTEIFARLRALLAAAAACRRPWRGRHRALPGLARRSRRCVTTGDGAGRLQMDAEVNGGAVVKPVIPVLAPAYRRACAQRLCVEGRLLDPEQARRAGLVDDLAAPGGAVDAAMTWCEHILSLPQEAMRATRAACREELRSLND